MVKITFGVTASSCAIVYNSVSFQIQLATGIAQVALAFTVPSMHVRLHYLVTGSSAFFHKAGVHSKAVIANPVITYIL